MSRSIGVALTVAALAAPAAAQPPRIQNGRVTTTAADAPLAGTIQALAAAQPEPFWIGYAAPAVPGERSMCCYDAQDRWPGGTPCCASCRLEPSATATTTSSVERTPSGPVRLEGDGRLIVLLRVDARQVERVRVFSADCPLDAGGRTVAWLENVRPADSIAYLESLVSGAAEARARVADGAVSAIALHGDAAADAALERMLAADRPERIRRAVPFWLGNARGARGLHTLRRIVRDDASAEVRKKAVFGISQSPEADAVDVLIDAARTSQHTSVRGEAVFWLAQRAGKQAAAAITERIEQDPDTEVKKKAVFALSQLPKDEGVPLLIGVARSHSNPAVRKQAMFWLGQSRDPRAIDFFAEVLGK